MHVKLQDRCYIIQLMKLVLQINWKSWSALYIGKDFIDYRAFKLTNWFTNWQIELQGFQIDLSKLKMSILQNFSAFPSSPP